MAHPELPSEQAYVDRAYDHLERMRAVVARAGDAADGEVAQAALDAWAARRLRTFEDAERGLIFGRLDFETLDRPLYVGRRWVHDDEQRQVVVNWQAPAARPFYTATPQDPHGVTLRRRFRTEGRRVLDLADEALDGSLLDGAAVGDFLLEELERDREQHMRDIVATIQADQYRLITHPPDRPLVVQGGPGTGKTAVGLHRASWLLYTHRDEALARRGVLVVGPNRTFMAYVSHVLPALGEEAVEQRAVGELVDGVEATLRDPLPVATLKADIRLAEVVRRAVDERLDGTPGELVLRLDGSFVQVREREMRELLESAREEHGTSAAARERFRMSVLRRFYEDYGRVHGDLALRSFEEVEKAVRGKGLLDRVLKAAWPVASPAQVVHGLLSTPAALARAAEGILDDEEQRLLARRGRGWSDADLPLLDEAATLLDGPPHAYGHVIVDEAQDLTPMQLRMVARRAPDGSLTLLGDIAQATGAIVYRTWGEVTRELPGDEAAVEELRHAYRVPREVMDLALPLLGTIAPGLEPPIAYRTGAAAPTVRRVAQEELLAEAWHEAAALAAGDGLLAVIAPEELVAESPAGDLWEGIPVLTPRAAKGLEFDHVVVVEPALMAAHAQGLRELYVALTRPTRTLVVLHARPLPDALAQTQ